MSKDRQSAVVLFSGGLDSTVVLYEAIKHFSKIYALTFDYGQRHLIELAYANRTVVALQKQGYSIQHQQVDIESVISTCCDSALITSELASVPDAGEAATWIVPGRNLIFLSLAFAYAHKVESSFVHIGVNADDVVSGFHDCKYNFFIAAEEAANIGLGRQWGTPHAETVMLCCPNYERSKQEVIERAGHLGIKLEDTWSCYNPTETAQPCQMCPACLLRKESQSETRNTISTTEANGE